jgi:NADP-dependent 3-hydroxy acid dehydrogenase YdfG
MGGERSPLGAASDVKAALVTGAAGGIGSAIVERLEVDGWSVGSISRMRT